jgi:murein L,D-transpeptidase YafK
MTFERNGTKERTFIIALGGAPQGDKGREGDLKTPEGELYVAWKNERSSFHRFLGLSYPMERHAERGYANGLIDKKTRDAIVDAVKSRKKPPQHTRLGGLVGIHGGGAGADWTLGCIAVSNEEAEWLFKEMQVGDRIVVHP